MTILFNNNRKKFLWWFMLWTIPTTAAFIIASPVLPSLQQQQQQQQHRTKNAFLLHMASSSTTKTPNFSSTDPFQILGIDPTADTQAIKRAYKKLAFQYHPDMVTTKDSTAEQKRMASDQFAKINAAYEALSGKTGRASSTSGNSSTRSSTNSNPNAWTPPHRRTTASSSSSSSTDWRDYIPYNREQDDQKYDAGGDSFGAIFADLFAGASSAAGGGGGVVRDFIEFLEQTVDAYSTTSSSSSSSSYGNEDADLQFLLRAGSIREVGDEMDETELVLQQLNKKMQQMDIEVMQLQADVATCTKFTQKMELEESLDELRARKRVVENYIQKARKRLLALQTRYKQLVVQGANDPKAGGNSRSADTASTNTSTSKPPSATPSNKNSDTTAEGESWKDESFGSFGGRGRGSSRRRAQRSTYESASTSATGNASSSSSSSSTSYNTNNASKDPSRNSSPASTPSSSTNYIPPHRRTQASSSTQDDQRRLRELKVDEEFEKLKRDLGL